MVLLTHAAWQRRFGGLDVVGQAMILNGAPHLIVGILPESFHFPLRGEAELCAPLDVSRAQAERRYWHWLDVIARLKPGVTPQQASAEMKTVAAAIAKEDPRWHKDTGIQLVPLREEIVGRIRPALLVLLAAVGLVLLITCANLGNLLLVRSTGRQKEIAVRMALGADRARLIRQLLSESALVAILGGAVGLAVALWGTKLLLMAIPPRQMLYLPHLRELTLDLPAALFALAVSLLSAAMFGLVPAFRNSRVDTPASLKETGRVSAGRASNRLSDLVVVAEVSLALVLLAGAGLLLKSFHHLLEVSPGFRAENLLTLRLSLPGSRYGSAELVRFHRQLLENIASLPGVKGVATASRLPLTGRGDTGSFNVEGRPADERTEVNIRTVNPSYFSTMGIPTLQGRSFDERDDVDSPRAILVNQTLAQRVFGGEPLGKRIIFTFFPGQPAWEIVGVVGNEQVDALDQGITPVVYFSYPQSPDSSFSLLVRSTVEAAAMTRAVQTEVQALDPGLPVYAVRTMDRIIADSAGVFLRRYLMFLLGGFAAVALMLAAVGIYGVVSYSVTLRSHEIGIRMALGARPLDVLWLDLRHGARLSLIGLACGLATALSVTRLMSSLLFGVAPTDPGVFLAVSMLLLTMATLASYVPARRSTRVHPIAALRHE